jgi:hypothetical protein
MDELNHQFTQYAPECNVEQDYSNLFSWNASHDYLKEESNERSENAPHDGGKNVANEAAVIKHGWR